MQFQIPAKTLKKAVAIQIGIYAVLVAASVVGKVFFNTWGVAAAAAILIGVSEASEAYIVYKAKKAGVRTNVY